MIELDPDQVGWSIRSSDGRSRMACRSTNSSQDSGKLTAALTLEQQTWQRDRPLQNAAMTRDFRIELPQVVLRIDSLRRLRQRLIEWQVNPAHFTSELCDIAAGDQHLSMSIGRDERLIADLFKPACIVACDCGPSMSGRWAFLVDQSCIRLCADSLGELLRSKSRPRV
ncbi:hypothetical protein [Rhizobacter sp. P5_C2]